MNGATPVVALLAAAPLAAAATWMLLPEPAGGPFSLAGERASVFLVLSLVALVPWLGAPRRRLLLAEGLALCLVGGLGVLLASDAGGATPPELQEIGGTLFGVMLLAWALALPARAAGLTGLGRLLFLGGPAALAGTPWIVAEGPERVPSFLVALNPIVRFHRGEDWFHAPAIYPLIGEKRYVYPDPLDGLGLVLALLGGALAAAVLIGRFRARRGADSALSSAPERA